MPDAKSICFHHFRACVGEEEAPPKFKKKKAARKSSKELSFTDFARSLFLCATAPCPPPLHHIHGPSRWIPYYYCLFFMARGGGDLGWCFEFPSSRVLLKLGNRSPNILLLRTDPLRIHHENKSIIAIATTSWPRPNRLIIKKQIGIDNDDTSAHMHSFQRRARPAAAPTLFSSHNNDDAMTIFYYYDATLSTVDTVIHCYYTSTNAGGHNSTLILHVSWTLCCRHDSTMNDEE